MGSGKTLSAVIATQCALQQNRDDEDMEIVGSYTNIITEKFP